MTLLSRVQQRIQFSNLYFSAPALFENAVKPRCGGIYAILVYDATCTPMPYRVIYFGEATNLSERVCYSHENYLEWARVAAGSPLYVAFCISTREAERKTQEEQLIKHYNPACNVVFNTPFLRLAALLGTDRRI